MASYVDHAKMASSKIDTSTSVSIEYMDYPVCTGAPAFECKMYQPELNAEDSYPRISPSSFTHAGIIDASSTSKISMTQVTLEGAMALAAFTSAYTMLIGF